MAKIAFLLGFLGHGLEAQAVSKMALCNCLIINSK